MYSIGDIPIMLINYHKLTILHFSRLLVAETMPNMPNHGAGISGGHGTGKTSDPQPFQQAPDKLCKSQDFGSFSAWSAPKD